MMNSEAGPGTCRGIDSPLHLRTPEEILQAIEKGKLVLESCPPENLQVIQGQIGILRWVLGQKTMVIG